MCQLRKDFSGQQKNHHYEEDIHYTLQMCQWLLKPMGLWPLIYKRVNRLQLFIGITLMTICISSLLFIVLPCGHYIFFVEKSISTKVKFIGPIGFCLSSGIKYCYLALKASMFGRCIVHIEEDWKIVQNPEHRTIMLKYVSISRNLITVCAVFIYSGGMSYHTVVPFLSKERNSVNYTIKPLAYPGYDAFLDTQSSPTYEIVFFLHCFAAMVMYSSATAAYSMAAIFVTHVCGQIQIQIARLEKLVRELEHGSDGYSSFTIIVHDHVRVLRFAGNAEKALREICLTEIAECTVDMALLQYYCLMEWRKHDMIAMLTFSTLLTSFTFNVFIFCYIGEILSEQCSQIGVSSYEIDWYNLPARRAYDLILLNAISQYPPKLTAGRIIDLSMNTFSTVVKTSVVYFNLLITVTNW